MYFPDLQTGSIVASVLSNGPLWLRVIEALGALGVLLIGVAGLVTSYRFGRWTRGQRDPRPQLVEGRITRCQAGQDPPHRFVDFELTLFNPGEMPILVRSVGVHLGHASAERDFARIREMEDEGAGMIQPRGALPMEISVCSEQWDKEGIEDHVLGQVLVTYFSGASEWREPVYQNIVHWHAMSSVPLTIRRVRMNRSLRLATWSGRIALKRARARAWFRRHTKGR